MEPEAKKSYVDLLRLKSRRCLEPTGQCNESAIRAHSIPNRAVLEFLHENGHVITPEVKVNTTTGPSIHFKSVGRNQASTFTGLCSTHDNALFKEIEQQGIDFDNPWHLFLICYRTVIRQLHVDSEAALRVRKAYELREELGSSKALSKRNRLAAIEHKELAYNMQDYKKIFDSCYLSQDIEDIFLQCFQLAGLVPTVSVSSILTTVLPGESKEGVPSLLLNVVPQPNVTSIILGGLKEHRPDFDHVLEYIQTPNSLETQQRLSALILKNCENFVVSPTFWTNLSAQNKKAISDYFKVSMCDLGRHPGDGLNLFCATSESRSGGNS